MCGIVGFVQNKPLLDRERLLRMRETLTHRGPDSAGLEVWDWQGNQCDEGAVPNIGFGHRRLSIIDLSEAGHQPMSNEDGTVWITYNGEFYNFGDYREELQAQGHVFRSNCDTETILHLYESNGMEETLRRMNGMFALGLYDASRRKLLLARDRIGQKPLYYMMLPDGGLMFASEMKALLASRQVDAQKLDPIGMAQFWTFGYTHGDRTIFEQIKQLPAGHWAEWSDGRLAVHKYWDCSFGLDVRETGSLDDWADELEALLCDAIRIRLIADVPVGLFLSGGIDSSLMAALVTKRLHRDLQSFTIAFQDAQFDESPFATAIARHLGIHNEILTVNEQMSPYFPAIAQQFDMPFSDSSSIPTYFVSKAAKAHVTVALTGDAGDELFGGYNWHAAGLRILGGEKGAGGSPSGHRKWVWESLLKLFGDRNGFALFTRLTGARTRKKIFAEELREAAASKKIWAERRGWHASVRGADVLAQMQYLDIKTYLAEDILVKVDRMSMANALECRSPFLDYRIVEFASRLPRRARIDDLGQRKRILTHLLARYVPEKLFLRPKQGFSVPWKTWCDKEMRKNLRADWQALHHPWFRAGSGDHLFPENGEGPVSIQWGAYSLIQFLQAHPAVKES